MEGKPEPAEINLLGAESIIGSAVGTDNDYIKTTYWYLNNLYVRWKKSEKAIEYRDLTAIAFDGILHLVVALRKLAMSAAGGVPCVGFTFLLPQSKGRFRDG